MAIDAPRGLFLIKQFIPDRWIIFTSAVGIGCVGIIMVGTRATTACKVGVSQLKKFL